ncbi:hypothetical protein MRX96_008655 [Rhipicephalus microplus]
MHAASRLSAIFNRNLDPCSDFYAFACTDWLMMSEDNDVYEDADDAITGKIEELARRILEAGSSTMAPLSRTYEACMQNASASSDDLVQTLTLFGLDLGKVSSPSAEDVLTAAASVFLGLGIAPLFSVALRSNAEHMNTTILALDEADVLLERVDASSYENVKKFTFLACKFLEIVHSAAERDNSTKACMSVALVAIDMAKSSSRELPFIDRMRNFTLKSFKELIAFKTMIYRIAKSERRLRDDTMLAVKNPAQIVKVKSLLSSKVQSLFYYLGLHVTVYLSPFLINGQPFEEASSFLLSGRSRSQPKWRICVRLVDMIMPGLLMLAFEPYMNTSNIFSELMAYIMAEESRADFVDEFSHLQHFDNWTKFVISEKLEQVQMLFLFPGRYSADSTITWLVNMIEEQVSEMNKSFEYFLKLSAIVASKWANTTWHFVSDVLPLSLYNISIPTSVKEGMFHIPRIGPRISKCLFEATFGTTALNTINIPWTETTLKQFDSTSQCLEKYYSPQEKVMTPAHRVEENSALVIAYENHCTSRNSPNDTKRVIMHDRVNVPLKNSYEFASAFSCKKGAPMNPSNKCSFWD